MPWTDSNGGHGNGSSRPCASRWVCSGWRTSNGSGPRTSGWTSATACSSTWTPGCATRVRAVRLVPRARGAGELPPVRLVHAADRGRRRGCADHGAVDAHRGTHRCCAHGLHHVVGPLLRQAVRVAVVVLDDDRAAPAGDGDGLVDAPLARRSPPRRAGRAATCHHGPRRGGRRSRGRRLVGRPIQGLRCRAGRHGGVGQGGAEVPVVQPAVGPPDDRPRARRRGCRVEADRAVPARADGRVGIWLRCHGAARRRPVALQPGPLDRRPARRHGTEHRVLGRAGHRAGAPGVRRRPLSGSPRPGRDPSQPQQ